MKETRHSALMLVAVLLPLSVLAEDATPRIDAREVRQEQRIQQGAASGALTPQETRQLERGQAHVDRMQDRAAADGVVTKQERARITQAQNVQDRKIRRQKHDRRHDLNHDGRKDRPHRGS